MAHLFQIRLLTTQHASADTVRLWLERSGDSIPLDIEIYLRVAAPNQGLEPSSSRTRRACSPLTPLISPWNIPSFSGHQSSPQYLGHAHSHPPPPSNVPIIMPPSPPPHSNDWDSPILVNHASDKSVNTVSRVSMHWGHIAFFYLVEQMHRWERFVFRFDKQFTSMGALKSINGMFEP